MGFSIVYFTCALLIGIVIGFCVMLIIHCLDAYIGEYKHEKKRRSEIKAIWKELTQISGSHDYDGPKEPKIETIKREDEIFE